MKHIKTINKANLKQSAEKGGCGKCTDYAGKYAGMKTRF